MFAPLAEEGRHHRCLAYLVHLVLVRARVLRMFNNAPLCCGYKTLEDALDLESPAISFLS